MFRSKAPGKNPVRLTPYQRKQRRLILIFVAAILASSAFMAGVYRPLVQKQDVPEVRKFDALKYFPLQKGNYWTYSYKTRTAADGGQITETSGTIRMEVERAYTRPTYHLAVLRGDPLNCEPDAVYGYLVCSNKVFYIPAAALGSIEEAAGQTSDLPVERLAAHGSPVFEFPLYTGLRWGPVEILARSDDKYGWRVVEEDYAQLGKGKKSPAVRCYTTELKTTADRQTVVFAPALGILSASCQHHGTPDDYEVKITGSNVD